MNDWNPDLYIQFKAERTQPAIDLINRIRSADPGTIIDVGCGPGNSTQALIKRWPAARVIGLDSSRAMIAKARQAYPGQQWILGDALTHAPDIPYDLIFSNAAIHWMPDHAALLARFHGMLSENGVLAVQIPLRWDMPLGRIIDEVAQDPRWRHKTEGVSELFTIHAPSFYYDQLCDRFSAVELWQTHYCHVLDGHEDMLAMVRSTGARPYLERLEDRTEKKHFEEAVLDRTRDRYPVQKDGRVLLPFKRLFFVGYRSPV